MPLALFNWKNYTTKRDNGEQVKNSSNDANVKNTGNIVDPQKSHISPVNGGKKYKSENDMSEKHTKLIFHCQQAHGSPTGLISGFSTVKELYEKIAECYDFPPDDILFCTLNTHKVDMTKLLGGQIGLEDFIFVHRKGRPKEVEIVKTDEALGLTITDNGVGYAFIKRVKENSIIDHARHICVGDHIERINNESMVGRRHFEVAKLLKDIPKDEIFTLRLIEPLKAGFSNIEPRSNLKKGKKCCCGTGKETLRFKANGSAQIEKEMDSASQFALDKINTLLENFLGISDNELASQIWETSEGKNNSAELAEAMYNSDLEELGFSEEFIIEVWDIISDIRSGRLVN